MTLSDRDLSLAEAAVMEKLHTCPQYFPIIVGDEQLCSIFKEKVTRTGLRSLLEITREIPAGETLVTPDAYIEACVRFTAGIARYVIETALKLRGEPFVLAENAPPTFCAVCQHDCRPGDVMTRFGCGHELHLECWVKNRLTEWYEPTCAYCRQRVVDGEKKP